MKPEPEQDCTGIVHSNPPGKPPGFDDMRRRKPLVEKLKHFEKLKPQTPLREIIRLTAG